MTGERLVAEVIDTFSDHKANPVSSSISAIIILLEDDNSIMKK